jgi:hypothetical protein
MLIETKYLWTDGKIRVPQGTQGAILIMCGFGPCVCDLRDNKAEEKSSGQTMRTEWPGYHNCFEQDVFLDDGHARYMREAAKKGGVRREHFEMTEKAQMALAAFINGDPNKEIAPDPELQKWLDWSNYEIDYVRGDARFYGPNCMWWIKTISRA